MRQVLSVVLGVLCLASFGFSQTADELIARNIQAKGGMDKIKAVQTIKMTGRLTGHGGFTAQVGRVSKRPNLVRDTFTMQGMTEIQAYNGSIGWQISPFEGRKDPELLGEDDLRDIVEEADFDGPLVDYQAKGNRVEYLGHDTVDGDDAYRLKVTLKNGDIVYYYLDPETALEIRTEKQQFIRGNVRETVQNIGSYKQVAGVYYPFSVEGGRKNDPDRLSKISVETIEVNLPVDDSLFTMPGAAAVLPKTAQPPKD